MPNLYKLKMRTYLQIGNGVPVKMTTIETKDPPTNRRWSASILNKVVKLLMDPPRNKKHIYK